MPPGMPPDFLTELFFTLVAVVFCSLIYLKTRQSYELTKHQGIRYFRDAFLFFGLSYAIRFFFSLLMLSMLAFDFLMPRFLLMAVFILLLGYVSTIGIIYLIFASVWKGFDQGKMLFLGHSTAIILSLASFFARSHITLVLLQIILLVIAVLLILFKNPGKKLSQAKVLYLLVALLWLLNLFGVGGRRPFHFHVEPLIQLFSLIVFFYIYHRVSKWAS